jgi:uncharacterized protein with HEPN domain
MKDMLDVCQQIQTYTAGLTLDEFVANRMVQDAVVRNIEILGEAAKQLLEVLPDAVQRFPSIPFRDMYVTRNRLIHGYDSLVLETVWEVAMLEIPSVLASVRSILAAWPLDLT